MSTHGSIRQPVPDQADSAEGEGEVPPPVIDPEILQLAEDFLRMKEKKDKARFKSVEARYKALCLLYNNAFYAREIDRQPFNDAVADAYNKGRERLCERWSKLVRSQKP